MNKKNFVFIVTLTVIIISTLFDTQVADAKGKSLVFDISMQKTMKGNLNSYTLIEFDKTIEDYINSYVDVVNSHYIVDLTNDKLVIRTWYHRHVTSSYSNEDVDEYDYRFVITKKLSSSKYEYKLQTGNKNKDILRFIKETATEIKPNKCKTLYDVWKNYIANNMLDVNEKGQVKNSKIEFSDYINDGNDTTISKTVCLDKKNFLPTKLYFNLYSLREIYNLYYEKIVVKNRKTTLKKTNAVKNIYFAGLYDKDGSKVDVQQYSSPSRNKYGFNVGSLEIYGNKVQLYKNGLNSYISEDGKLKITVKKNSIILKGGIVDHPTFDIFKFNDEFKLVFRYPRP